MVHSCPYYNASFADAASISKLARHAMLEPDAGADARIPTGNAGRPATPHLSEEPMHASQTPLRSKAIFSAVALWLFLSLFIGALFAFFIGTYINFRTSSN